MNVCTGFGDVESRRNRPIPFRKTRRKTWVHLASISCLGLLVVAVVSVADANAASTLRVPKGQPAAPTFSAELRQRLEVDLGRRGAEYKARTRHRRPDGSPLFTNRLLLEKSPYLRQHAHNPVNWFPWSPEAFAEARRLGRPVLVSIGYSTCHWCHVMEEESFDSVETAKLLNRHFIAIKVDREARPDIDAIYMSAIHAMGERGGWPLNLFVTFDGKPFFGGTYFPPQDRGGRPGFPRVLNQIATAYAEDPDGIRANADQLAAHLKAQLEGHVGTRSALIGTTQLDRVIAHYLRIADREWGGVGRDTKFPSSLPIGLLLRESRRTGNADALALARLTLDRMAGGGIHDHLAGGFHRYSTEPKWLVPHFEKMLYDNALIAMSYLEAFQATGERTYALMVRDVIDYVLAEMAAPGGGFYSATDADSFTSEGESEEGYFFTWSRQEVVALLGPEDSRLALAWFGVVEAGPLEGRNVLHTWRDEASVALELGLSLEQFEVKRAAIQDRMLAARSLRSPPLRDDKILVAWNGLMVSALARSGFALRQPAYVEAASKTAQFILSSMTKDGRLSRISLDGEVGGPAFLGDYAFLIAGLLDLFEASGEPRWIEAALSLQAMQDQHYGDAAGGGYYRVAGDGEVMLAREKPIRDGAIPSGNSIAAANLSRLAAFSADPAYGERLALLYSAFAEELERPSAGSAALMQTVSDREVGLREIVLVEAMGAGGVEAMLAPLRTEFVPNRVFIRTREGDRLDSLAKMLPILRGKKAIGGKTTAYVCQNQVCQYPTADAEQFRTQLQSLPGRAARARR